MRPLSVLNKLCKFNDKYECYVLLAIARKKNNENMTGGQEIVFRQVIKDKENIAKKYSKLKTLAENYRSEDGKKFNFYIYVSANARCSKKTYFEFQRKCNLWVREAFNGVDVSNKFKRLDAMWLSALLDPKSKAKRGNFLIDLDDKGSKTLDMTKKKLENIGATIELVQETRNGYHIVTSPFHKQAFEMTHTIELEVKSDALLFLESIGKFEEVKK